MRHRPRRHACVWACTCACTCACACARACVHAHARMCACTRVRTRVRVRVRVRAHVHARARERGRGASVREHGALPFGWFCTTALTIAPAFLRNCRLAIGIIAIIIISIVMAQDHN